MIVYILTEDNTLDFVYNCPPDVMELGKFLLPSIPYATVPPPECGENEIAVYQNNSWSIKPDFRGHSYWLNGVQYHIASINETIPEGATDGTIPPVQENSEIVVTPWQIRQVINQLGLRSRVEDLIKTTSNQDIKDGWEYVTEWKEFHPVVTEMAAQLGLTSEEIHAIFVLAKEK